MTSDRKQSKTPSTLIDVENLSKAYGKLLAVKGISFKVYRGECFGLLGPNGAGKTTTIKMLQCVLPRTSGKIIIDGMNVDEDHRAIKAAMGVAPQENNLDPDFTTLKNLTVYARYFNIAKEEAEKRAKRLLRLIGLEKKSNVIIDSLSGGMKRRLILARALMNEPEILILDEPTTGLDPQTKRLIWERVDLLRDSGVTIILATQNMEEATELCDRIIIMNEGRIIAEGKPRNLVHEKLSKWVLRVEPAEEAEKYIRRNMRSTEYQTEGDRLFIFTNNPEALQAELMSKLKLKETVIRESSLEDLFLKLTGRGIQE
ncbi:MAG: ABC transporter ATP-binding protein [Promethearchaeati archaeon SRVP18_Atabeyarchaeia-1]